MFDFKWKENGSIKLLIIVGTRPEIIRLAATIKRCREYFDCCVAHTGQNYDKNLNDIFWSDFELGGPDVCRRRESGTDLRECYCEKL